MSTRLFGLLGDPVASSLSPALHGYWLEVYGIDARYVAQRCRGDVAAVLRAEKFAGANLTTPLKRAILGDLATITPAAQAIGAVNTVVVGADGALHGDNTDAAGLAASLGNLAGREAIVLGAGGAGRAAAYALLTAGSPRVTVLNRTVAAAEALARDLGGPIVPGPLTPGAFDAAATARLVVNATTGAARDAVLALDPRRLPADAAWCDLNYWDPDPPGFAACRASGRQTVDGGDMLVRQAALAFARFTGVTPAPDEIARAWARAVSPERGV